MLQREELLAGIARQAMTVLESNLANAGMAAFLGFLETIEVMLPQVRHLVQAEAEAAAEGRVDDSSVIRQQLFRVCIGIALGALSMVSHYPGLK